MMIEINYAITFSRITEESISHPLRHEIEIILSFKHSRNYFLVISGKRRLQLNLNEFCLKS